MLPRHPPDNLALISRERSIAWEEWDRLVEAASRRLSIQAPSGGIVAFRADDSVESAVIVLGALGAGVVVAPLSPRLPKAAADSVATRLRATMLGADGADPSSLPDDVRGIGGVVVHTSGSSGDPKAALLTADSLVAGAAGLAEAFGLVSGDAWLMDLPMHHVAGIGVVMRCAVAGAAVAIPSPGDSTSLALRSTGATHVSLVDTQLYRLLSETDARPPADLRLALLGGGPVPAALVDRAVEMGWPVSVSYGLTEMGSTVTATAPGALLPEPYTAGRPLPGREVVVVDGEVCVRGAGLFAGYLTDGRLERALDDNGYFRTGDLGSIDEEGRLVVAGRADGLFVSGGENVQPEEVEAALVALPGVLRAVVVPVPDAEFGRRGVAFVETEDGLPLDAAALSEALGNRLERFKHPVRYLPWPAGLTGLKPNRRVLANLAAGAGGKPIR